MSKTERWILRKAVTDTYRLCDCDSLEFSIGSMQFAFVITHYSRLIDHQKNHANWKVLDSVHFLAELALRRSLADIRDILPLHESQPDWLTA